MFHSESKEGVATNLKANCSSIPSAVAKLKVIGEHTARPVLPKAPGVWKYATLQNLTLDEL